MAFPGMNGANSFGSTHTPSGLVDFFMFTVKPRLVYEPNTSLNGAVFFVNTFTLHSRQPPVIFFCVLSKHSGFQKRSIHSTLSAMASLMYARAWVEPRREVISTQSMCSMPYFCAVRLFMRTSDVGNSSRAYGDWRMVP